MMFASESDISGCATVFEEYQLIQHTFSTHKPFRKLYLATLSLQPVSKQIEHIRFVNDLIPAPVEHNPLQFRREIEREAEIEMEVFCAKIG